MALRTRRGHIDLKAFGALLRALDTFDGRSDHRAALLIALLFPRSRELRMAEWTEFDLEEVVGYPPAGCMKMRRPHAVPLATQARAVVKGLREIIGCDSLVFPGLRTPMRAISENTLNGELRRLGHSRKKSRPMGSGPRPRAC